MRLAPSNLAESTPLKPTAPSRESGDRLVNSRPHSTGRILRLAGFERLKIEGRDRISARAGPTAGSIPRNPWRQTQTTKYHCKTCVRFCL